MVEVLLLLSVQQKEPREAVVFVGVFKRNESEQGQRRDDVSFSTHA
jgi:hypothetical protein